MFSYVLGSSLTSLQLSQILNYLLLFVCFPVYFYNVFLEIWLWLVNIYKPNIKDMFNISMILKLSTKLGIVMNTCSPSSQEGMQRQNE